MRYHFGSLTPSSQKNRQSRSPLIQRSSPTCTLSLANATASTASNDILRDSDAMVVDPPSISMTSLSTVQNAVIPFPTTGKRTHSLLRATAYSPRLTTAVSARESDEACSTDPDPPRKRTRTSALPSSTKRFNRGTSVSIHIFRSTFDSSLPSATSKSTPTSADDASHSLLGSAQPNRFPSSLNSPTIDSLPLHGVSDATQSVVKPLVRPIPSSRWRHKRPASCESKFVFTFHQALVYGLALRFPTGKPDIANTTDNTSSGPLQSGKGGANAYLYLQDAILSQRLRAHLLANGIDAFQETFQGLNSEGEALCLPSATHVVLAYRRLVASLIIRHRSSSNRPRGRDNGRFQRKPSRLSAFGNSD